MKLIFRRYSVGDLYPVQFSNIGKCLTAPCFPSQSHLCFFSVWESLGSLLSNCFHGYKVAPCFTPISPPPKVIVVLLLLCVHFPKAWRWSECCTRDISEDCLLVWSAPVVFLCEEGCYLSAFGDFTCPRRALESVSHWMWQPDAYCTQALRPYSSALMSLRQITLHCLHFPANCSCFWLSFTLTHTHLLRRKADKSMAVLYKKMSIETHE